MTQPILNVPTRDEIQAIEVGSMALNCFGRMAKVVEVTAKREDINGKLFVCYYVETSPTSRMSMSQKEDHLTRTVAASNRYKSAELDKIEAEIVATRALEQELFNLEYDHSRAWRDWQNSRDGDAEREALEAIEDEIRAVETKLYGAPRSFAYGRES